MCVYTPPQVRPSTQARHAEQKGTPDSDRNVCMCKTTMPRGAGGANRQDDVEKEGRRLPPGHERAVGKEGGRGDVAQFSEICLSAQPFDNNRLPVPHKSPFGRVRL